MILRVCLHLRFCAFLENSVVYFIPSTGNRFGWPHYKSFRLLPFASLWTPPKGIKILYLFIKVNHQSSCCGSQITRKCSANMTPSVWIHLISVQFQFKRVNWLHSKRKMEGIPWKCCLKIYQVKIELWIEPKFNFLS